MLNSNRSGGRKQGGINCSLSSRSRAEEAGSGLLGPARRPIASGLKVKGRRPSLRDAPHTRMGWICNSRLRREFHLQGKGGRPRSAPAPPATPPAGAPTPPSRPAPAFVRLRKPAESSLMHPFQWCNGCFCGLGLVSTNKSCSMPPISFQDLPLNIYMVIFGTGIFVFMLSLIFCCYFISKLRNQAQSERYGYKEVVLKGDAKKLQLYGQTCAVCLEDFRGKDELGVLPCQHAFHRKCLVKWLEVRCVCPMCNKPIAGPSEASQSIGILLDELV